MGTPDFARAYQLDGDALWNAHRAAKQELLRVMRARGFGEAFDPDALTIGFARRFATYKRADLIFSDLDRLARAARRLRSGRCRSCSPARRTRRTRAARR